MNDAQLSVRQAVAQTLLGPVEWISESQGRCTCPGSRDHTSGDSWATVYLDGAASIHCFHNSCDEAVADANKRLRREISKAEHGPGFKYVPTEQDTKRRQNQLLEQRLLQRSKATFRKVVSTMKVTPDEWLQRSPLGISDDLANHWRVLLEALPPDDRIWIGEMKESGGDWFKTHFREVNRWLVECSICPGPFICPAHFKPDTGSRSRENVEFNRFVIIESDKLSKDEVGSVFCWLGQHWHLVAIVDTGNKSLHGWFEKPSNLTASDWREFSIILKGFGCDTAMFRPNQPCRLPGCIRLETGRWQRLLYLDRLKWAFSSERKGTS